MSLSKKCSHPNLFFEFKYIAHISLGEPVFGFFILDARAQYMDRSLAYMYCINWTYVIEAELSKLCMMKFKCAYLHYLSFLQKAIVQYIDLKLVLLNLLKLSLAI